MKKRNMKLTALFLSFSLCLSFFKAVPVSAVTPAIPGGSSALPPIHMETEEIQLFTPLILEEDIEKRGEYEKHFLCDDGSYMAIAYPVPVHMQQGEDWIDISYGLSLQEERLVDTNSNLDVSFAQQFGGSDDQLVRFTAGDYTISWSVEADVAAQPSAALVQTSQDLRQPVNLMEADAQRAALLTQKSLLEAAVDEELLASPIAPPPGTLDTNGLLPDETPAMDQLSSPTIQDIMALNAAVENYNRSIITSISTAQARVTYPQALGVNTSVQYTVTPDRVKEEVVLSQKDESFTSYTIRLNTAGLQAVAGEYGSISLCDPQGDPVITIAPPVMYDSADVVSEDIAVSVVQTEEFCTVTYTPSAEWLNAPERVYPVVIDPTFYSNSAGSSQSSTFVYSGQTSGSFSSNPYMFVGYYARNGGTPEHVAYWRVNTLPTMTSASITSASMNLRFANNTTTMGNGIYMANVGSSWSTSSLTSWNARPQEGSSIAYWTANHLASSDPKWVSATVTSYVKNWVATGVNHGFMLRYISSTNDWNQFYSTANSDTSRLPYLAITYNVIIPVTAVEISHTNVEIPLNSSLLLSAQVYPTNAPQGLVWSSSSPSIASVSGSGMVTALSAGSAIIYAHSAYDSTKYAACSVTVKNPPSSITVTPGNLELIVGETHTLIATIQPSGALSTLNWTSNNNSVATVSNTYFATTLTANAPGDATIFARSTVNNNIFGVCNVTVFAALQAITLPQTYTASVGDVITLSPTFSPAVDIDPSVTWSVPPQNVLIDEGNGVFTAVGAGTATVTVTSTRYPGKSASCVVTVTTDIALLKGERKQLSVGLFSSPLDYTWSSNDDSVATVSSSGEVQATGIGTTTIQAISTTDPNKPVKSWTINVPSLTFTVYTYYDPKFLTETQKSFTVFTREYPGIYNVAISYLLDQFGITLTDSRSVDRFALATGESPNTMGNELYLRRLKEHIADPDTYFEGDLTSPYNIFCLWSGHFPDLGACAQELDAVLLGSINEDSETALPSDLTTLDMYKLRFLHEVLHALGVIGDDSCDCETCIMTHKKSDEDRATYLRDNPYSTLLCEDCTEDLYERLHNFLIPFSPYTQVSPPSSDASLD